MSQADVMSWERGESALFDNLTEQLVKRHNYTDGAAVFVASSVSGVVIQKYLFV